ncbi:MAG: cytochrome c3 family protein [Acidobacteriota bacterium]
MSVLGDMYGRGPGWSGKSGFWLGISVWMVSAVAAAAVGSAIPRVKKARRRNEDDPDAECASCHRAIYDRYKLTPMAHASGPATEGLIDADFRDAASGVHYRVCRQGGRVWLSYERNDAARPLKGQQELRYFVGSGLRGRTYLFEQQGYWFEAPINWYAKKRVWDMAPAYQGDREMPLTLKVDPGCLHCHASEVASSLPDARNHYAGAPFGQGGITCAACHGDGSAHVASGGKVKMLDIDALEPARRDSICLNCHLEGQVGVNKLGKRPEEFRPGDDLFDFSVYFVHRGEEGSGGRATSQWEALLKSQCKRRSGDKLTCTTCHDPHGDPPPQERVAYYRAKCLQCHAGMAKGHHAENPNCVECHMGRPPANDIAHEQVTDHWIRKRVSSEALPVATTGPLRTVGEEEATGRDWGLAYAQLGERGDQDAGMRAIKLLRRAERNERGAGKDARLHAQLGFLEQTAGDTSGAVGEYRAALSADPVDNLAAANLAVIEFEGKDVADAERGWAEVVEHAPMDTTAGIDLAVAECGGGLRQAAEDALARVLEFAPDDQRARTMLGELEDGKQGCRGR